MTSKYLTNTSECYWDRHCGHEKIQSDCVSSPSRYDGLRDSGTKSRRGEEEEAARFECSKGRRYGENTLGEGVKGIGKWRDIKNVRSVQQRGAEGLEVWDEVSHFNAKKAYLLQAR